MTRWKITLEYEGTGFSGWQRQANDISVQQTLEEAVQKFSGEAVVLFVAGRTDAGVHAYANVAHFDLQKQTTPETVRDALNFHVRPHKVVVLAAEQVSEQFHARFSALARSYRYQILNRRVPSALLVNKAWHVQRPLDIQSMQKAADTLIGHHDFTTFRAQHCQSNSPLKTLDRLDVTAHEESVFFFVKARSFLYHQVRNMVGTLMLVGSGQWTQENFTVAFDAHDRKAGGPTAPAHGLYFRGADYPADYEGRPDQHRS